MGSVSTRAEGLTEKVVQSTLDLDLPLVGQMDDVRLVVGKISAGPRHASLDRLRKPIRQVGLQVSSTEDSLGPALVVLLAELVINGRIGLGEGLEHGSTEGVHLETTAKTLGVVLDGFIQHTRSKGSRHGVCGDWG